MKKRLLCLMASLLLCGAVSAQAHFEVDTHAQDNNMPVVAQVVLDGDTVTTGGYELGAFIGDEVRGSAQIQAGLDNTYWIQVYYSTDDEATATVSFKLYDGDDEYTAETTLTVDPEGYGTPSEPVEIEFATVQTMTQSTALVSGWNWWSTPVEMNGIDGLTMLENSLGTSGVRIQSLNNGRVDYYDYNGGIWYGQLNTIYNEQMYKVNTSVEITSVLNGYAAVPSNHPITISENWNWIGFPYNQAVSLDVAMSGFTPNSLDQIKSLGDGYATYYVTNSFTGWYGTLNTLQPGKGYMYYSKSSDDKTLVYQTSRGEAIVENITPDGNIFMPREASFADNMTVTAVVELEGVELRNGNYEVAAFVGKDCRGSVKLMYVEPLDRYIAFLLIAGDKEESLRFALTDGDKISWSNDNLMYSTNAIIGDLSEPTVLHFGPLGLDDNYENMISVYPNPSTGIYNIQGNGIHKVEIINTFGQVVLSKEIVEDNVQIDLSNYAIGVYLLRVITDNSISTKQLIKE